MYTGLQSASLVKLAAEQPKQNKIKWVALRRLLIKTLNDSSSLWRTRVRDFYFGFYQTHRLPTYCVSTFSIWKEHCSLHRIFGLNLWAGFFWLTFCSHCPLCRTQGWDGVTAVWKGCLLFAPRNSVGPGHSLQCCPLAWVSGSSDEAVRLSACSDEPVLHPCHSALEMEATMSRLLLFHVFMWVWDGSSCLSKHSELHTICKEFLFFY